MAGYGNADDHVGAQEAHVEDSLALHRLQQEQQDNQTGFCIDCEDPIPAERLILVPGALRCSICQTDHEDRMAMRRKFTFRPGYMP